MTRSTARLLGLAAIIAGIGLLTWSFARPGADGPQEVVLAELARVAQSPNEAIDDVPDDFPAIVDSAVRDPETNQLPVGAALEVIETFPHDTEAFTQGLELLDGRLFESTGIVGESTLREVDLVTGEVLRSIDVDDVFAEGLTVVDDTAIQLTWRDGEAYRYDLDTFERLETYTYEGEGWGLCDDGTRLVMSDGTPTLQFRDRSSFELLSTVDVLFNNSPVDELNELECVDGRVWSNIWKSSLIIEIDPESGQVTTVLNARSLTPESVEGSTSKVLNGIAFDASDGSFLLTGKEWPSIFRVQIEPRLDAAIR